VQTATASAPLLPSNVATTDHPSRAASRLHRLGAGTEQDQIVLVVGGDALAGLADIDAGVIAGLGQRRQRLGQIVLHRGEGEEAVLQAREGVGGEGRIPRRPVGQRREAGLAGELVAVAGADRHQLGEIGLGGADAACHGDRRARRGKISLDRRRLVRGGGAGGARRGREIGRIGLQIGRDRRALRRAPGPGSGRDRTGRHCRSLVESGDGGQGVDRILRRRIADHRGRVRAIGLDLRRIRRWEQRRGIAERGQVTLRAHQLVERRDVARKARLNISARPAANPPPLPFCRNISGPRLRIQIGIASAPLLPSNASMTDRPSPPEETCPSSPAPAGTASAPSSPPDSAAAFRTAASLHEAGKFDEAEVVLREAVGRDPGNSDLWNARGVMFAALGRPTDALWCYREALTRNPAGPGIWTNLGNALTQMKQIRSAVACHQRAIALSGGGDALLHHNLGVSLAEAGQHGEAVIAFTRALERQPDYHMARWDRARSYLYLGNYRPGWADYEIRLVTGQLPKRALPGRKWDGTPYPGRRLLLLVEQGFGDTIWVARYLPRVKALGGELVIECQKEVIPLLAGMGVADRIVPRDAPLPDADFHAHLCSLPGLFSPDIAAIPASPYLAIPYERVGRTRPLFEAARGRFKVGIVWSGSVTFKKNHERAQSLMRFLQAFGMPGVQLYSLQKGPPQQELAALPAGIPVIDLAPHLDDFADTAAAIAQLDLVIMTDSAVAHLAGALGKPVWVLLGHVAHWLWLLDRTDSPWYPSLRLFRPRAEGDWDHVFDSAAAALMSRVRI
jgi:Flp pilus assembly protein TadD